MKEYIIAERIRGSSVLFNIISRYGGLKVQQEITREVLVKMVSNPPYTPVRKKIRGKIRLLHVPSKKLKILLKAILDIILYDFAVSGSAHGGIPERSIVTNAQSHLNASSFFQIDFKNYFPSITTRMIVDRLRDLFEWSLSVGFFRNCGLISFRDARGLAGVIGRLATFKNALPQGAPTSSYLQNLIFYDLDEKIRELCRKHDITYTRFIDDMIFSSRESRISKEIREEITILIKKEVGHFLKFNREKIHYRTGKAKASVITGVTIVPMEEGAPKLSISKEQIERYRSILHQASLDRISPERVWGIIGFVTMVTGGIPSRLRNPFMRFLGVYYPDSWDKKLDHYDNLQKK